MAVPSSIRLIIAESSENRAHEIDSILRDAGLATRFDLCPDVRSIEENLAKESCDLLFFNASSVEMETVLPELRKKHPELPIIVMSEETDNSNHNMDLGATDVIRSKDKTHLLHVVQRELQHITDRQHLYSTRLALDEAEKRCELLLASSNAAIAYVHEGMHIHANGVYLKLFGFSTLKDLEGVPLLDLADTESLGGLKKQLKSFRGSDSSGEFDFTGKDQNGVKIQGAMTLSSAEYEGESCTQVIFKTNQATSPASTSLQVLDERVPEDPQTKIQPATNLEGNPGLQALILATENKSSGALMIIELDAFAGLQNKHGLVCSQSIGDQTYKALCEAGEIFRLGAHRFAVFMESGTMVEHENHAKALKKRIEDLTLIVGTETIECTASIGAVEIDGHEALPPIETAFYTLSELKAKSGTNEIVWDNGEDEGNSQLSRQRRQMKEQGRLIQAIDTAIANKSFSLLFQPIISLRGDEDEHYEVFMRMQGDTQGQMAPGEFLEAAKENGSAGKIDRWVILQAIKVLTEHRSKGHATRLTINLTFNSVLDPDFLEWIAVAIKAANLPSDAVIFQVTEADAVAYPEETAEFIRALKSVHCRTSLGRFGLADKPFELLKNLDVDFVKLDGSLVNAPDQEIFTATIQELQACGKLSIVPMVESATVLATLWQAGANYIQGHYLQAPESEMSYDFSTQD